MQPESALASWRHWDAALHSRPVNLGPLDGGRSNRSYLLESDGQKMVLRLNGEASLLPGANRSPEIKIWQAASQQGIAPPLIYVDEDALYLVNTFIPNQLPATPPLDKTYIDQALSLLNRCHQLKVDAPIINYASHIEHYWQIIESKNTLLNPALIEQREPMRLMLETLLSSSAQTGLCHHDPVIPNFVGTPNRLYLIDWEYAAHGLLVIDYAALSTEWGIDDATILARTGIEPELLTMAKSLYKYLCELWVLS